MQIEVGKYYRTRSGLKAGPVEDLGDGIISADVAGDQDGRLFRGDGTHVYRHDYLDLIAEWTDPQHVTISPTWEVMDPADAVHDLERIPLPDGRVYARRVVVPVMGDVALYGKHFGGRWGFGPTQFDGDTHRITLPTRDGDLIAGTYTSADGHSVVVGVV